jgi:hypothetical protein
LAILLDWMRDIGGVWIDYMFSWEENSFWGRESVES